MCRNERKTKIIYEDNGILVCRKPAGLAVQTAAGYQSDMVSELKNYLSRMTGEKNPYLGVVHRLDQPVGRAACICQIKESSRQPE